MVWSENVTDFMMNNSNDITQNMSAKVKDGYMITKLFTDFPTIFLTCLGPVVSFASLTANAFVLEIIFKVSKRELKSKILLTNALIIDILFPFTYSLGTVLYVAVAFGLANNYSRFCLDGLIAILSPTTQYAQTLSHLALVSDRLYAVLFPLHYHIFAYSTLSSVCILSMVWTTSIGLMLPVFIFAKNTTGNRGICFGLAEAHRDWNNTLRFPLIIGMSGFIFVIYAILFVLIKWRRSPITSNNKVLGISRKEPVSLVLTFFVVHLSCLALYIPGPLFAILVRSGSVNLGFNNMWKIRRSLIILFLLNSLIDPVIMTTRIPCVKYHLIRKWLSTGRRRRGNSITKTEDQPLPHVNSTRNAEMDQPLEKF